MPKPLVIVESPAKARTIKSFLGDEYVVMASIGHIRDLPRNAQEVPKQFKGTEAGRLGIDVENHFQPIYIVPKEKKSVVKDLKHALKNASELVLATDEDREGEAISWHVLEVLKPDVPMKRMVFHEITKHAIDDALGNWRSLDEKLIEAQEGRRVLDRLVGYELSPVLWKRVMPRLSAGRVQSVATRLIVERERARIAFRSASYWDLEGTFQADETSFPARLAEVGGRRVAAGRDFDAASGALTDDATGAGVLHLGETEARALVGALDGAEFRVASVESKAFTERPKPPFTTSTLQQEAGRKLRFSSAKTMAVAQRLYERGHITYMRTDSTNLSSEAVTAARQEIGSRFGAEYLPSQPRTFKSKVKNAQEAHEAIRPAGDQIVAAEALSDLDADERRVYELIWMRTLACQMSDARANRVAVRLAAAASNGEAVEFAASGKSYDFLGFRRAYVEDSDDPAADESESRLPVLAEGDRVECVSVEASDHATQPPARFTEASLVKELEEDGIGRPSTYASVIQTIQDRGYVWKKGSALVPTWTAFAVVQLLERHFDQLVDYKFTARMEEDLDVIARGEGESEKWLHSFYFGNGQRGLKELVGSDHLDEIDARSINTIPLGTDPNGRDVAVRVGRYGPYLQRDDDTVSLPDDLPPDELSLEDAVDRLERGKDGGRVLGRDPESGLDVIARDGRYGPYVQLGELVDGAEEKPKTASLLKAMTLDTMTLQEALAVLALPRVVGADAEGKEITVQNGRYGPYLKKGNDSRSLDTEEQIFTVTVAEAEALFAQPKRRRAQKPPIAELGPHPDSGALVKVLDGRYGPYATDGTTNATLPRGRDPESVTLEEAVALIREREARGPRRPRKTTKRTVKKRTPAKKRTSAKKRAPGKKRTRAKAPTETPVASGS